MTGNTAVRDAPAALQGHGAAPGLCAAPLELEDRGQSSAPQTGTNSRTAPTARIQEQQVA
jgi:hypothetical protein